MTNIDPNTPASFPLRIPGHRVKRAIGQVLTADRVDTVNTFEVPDAVRPRPVAFTASADALAITLQPRSVTVVRVED